MQKHCHEICQRVGGEQILNNTCMRELSDLSYDISLVSVFICVCVFFSSIKSSTVTALRQTFGHIEAVETSCEHML